MPGRAPTVPTTQAAGPKIAWIADEEPEHYARARRLYMPSSWLVRRLTGAYVLDHHSASQCTPLYDTHARQWYAPWAAEVAPGIELPPLRWSGEAAGTLTPDTARETGLPAGIPVTTGTIDTWAEALSVGAQGTGDLMLMYGTTMFVVHTVPEPLTSESLWAEPGLDALDLADRAGVHAVDGGAQRRVVFVGQQDARPHAADADGGHGDVAGGGQFAGEGGELVPPDGGVHLEAAGTRPGGGVLPYGRGFHPLPEPGVRDGMRDGMRAGTTPRPDRSRPGTPALRGAGARRSLSLFPENAARSSHASARRTQACGPATGHRGLHSQLRSGQARSR
ncbi:FGGY family carbohydrate kinase [Streptomyces coelicoflavus]|uniref:FGGY family carbohydrate kinase n=1 Tax=Streptomyces coelicoflavus TaxID=285562 RepID=UPI003B9874CB